MAAGGESVATKSLGQEKDDGRVDAAWYWHCSRARTFLQATTVRQRSDALRQVLRIRDSAFYEYGLEETDRQARDEVLDEAAAGNTDQLALLVNANCPRHTQ